MSEFQRFQWPEDVSLSEVSWVCSNAKFVFDQAVDLRCGDQIGLIEGQIFLIREYNGIEEIGLVAGKWERQG